MIWTKFHIHLFCATVVLASIEIHKMGWLDRVVQYHKNKFYNDVLQTNPVEIKATIVSAPRGYRDSPSWDIDSVMRLILLITESEASKPVKLALRRVLRPSRRIMMSKALSYKYFPSLTKDLANNIYYDINTDEEYIDTVTNVYNDVPEDDDVIIVSNPVESRLPSAQISVRLLREILENRAEGARPTQPTTKRIIPWVPMVTTASSNTTNSTHGNATTEATHNITTAVTESGANKTSEDKGKSNETAPGTDKDDKKHEKLTTALG